MILKDKLQKMRVLVREIEKRQNRLISREAKAAIQESRDRFEFRIKELDKEFRDKVQGLSEEYADKEADVKLEGMEKELELLK